MNSTPVSVLLSMVALIALSYAAPTVPPPTVAAIFSWETQRFFMFRDDGNVSADGDFNTPETNLYIEYFIDGTLRIRSVNVNKVCYLIFENETFQGGLPSNNNDIFELVQVNANSVAFRVVRNNSSQSGSGASEEDKGVEQSESDGTVNGLVESVESANVTTSECYLGFAGRTSGPECYTSTEYAATRFKIYD